MNITGETWAWVQVLGWSLLHFVWQGLLIGLLFALARCLIARDHSSLRYAVGLFSLAALALCPPLTLWLLRPQADSEATSLATHVVVAEPTATLVATLDSGTGLSELLPLLVMGWMFGVIFMVLRAANQWRTLNHIATKLAYRQADIESLLLVVAERIGGMHGTRILVSKFIDTPTLIGWFRPVILLPAAVVIGFPRQQLELILAHELGHLRRFDHLVNLGQVIVEALLFYHPVVHWISREIRHEREICCDNLVLSLTDSEPREYARTLAALEDVRQLMPQMAIAASGGMLLDRVRRIVGAAAPHPIDRHSRTVAWGVVASCTVLISIIALLAQSTKEIPAGVFDQPTSFSVNAGIPRIALIPNEPVLEFAAIQAPLSPVPTPAVRVEDGPAANPGIASEPDASPRLLDVPAPVIVATPFVDRANHGSLAMPEVADLELQVSVPALAAAPTEAAASRRTPVLLHQVAPDYPDNGRAGARASVGFLFSIDGSGRVRDIRSVAGDTQSAFAAAAKDALRQWRFDPDSLEAGEARNFRQDFEFVSASRAVGDETDKDCITPTGSHLCRPGRGIGLAFKAEEKAATISQSDHVAVLDAEQDDSCSRQTGSLACRPHGEEGLAKRLNPQTETSAQTIVLAGGSP